MKVRELTERIDKSASNSDWGTVSFQLEDNSVVEADLVADILVPYCIK